MDTPLASVLAVNFVGDKSGALVVHKGQALTIVPSEMELPTALYVEDGATALLPAELMMCRGIFVTASGAVSYPRNLTVGDGCTVTYNVRPSNVARFDYWQVKDGGLLRYKTSLFGAPGTALLVGISVDLFGGATMEVEDSYLELEELRVEAFATLTAAATVAAQAAPTSAEGVYGAGVRSVAIGSGGSGGGHGGSGGVGSGTATLAPGGAPMTGAAFDDFRVPADTGRQGGPCSWPFLGGRGGGRILVNTSGEFFVDGVVSAAGGAGIDPCAGGGSGGTVTATSLVIDGAGVIDVSGGAGSGAGGGGGGGGRVALIAAQRGSFTGRFDVYGALGNGRVGGAGTAFSHSRDGSNSSVFTSNRNNAPTQVPLLLSAYRNISIDDGRTWLVMETGAARVSALFAAPTGSSLQLTELQLWRSAHVAMRPSNPTPYAGVLQTLRLGVLVGDKSGVLHAGAFQALESQTALLPVSLYMYNESDVSLPGTVEVNGVTLDMSGDLRNVGYFVIGAGGLVIVRPIVTRAGTISDVLPFVGMEVRSQGQLTFRNGRNIMRMVGTSLRIFGNGLLTGAYLDIRAVNVTVDPSALLDANALGMPSNTGVGRGLSTLDFQGTSGGTGGSHGGRGGRSGGRQQTAPSYGSLRRPETFGSGGGVGCSSSAGGSGGGILLLTVSDTLVIDGTVRASGENAPGLCAGGGAGGTVLVNTTTLDGAGSVEVNGGNGQGTTAYFGGGGGGGGRIAVYVLSNTFAGSMSAVGGAGLVESGAAGTIYREDSTSGVRVTSLTLTNTGVAPENGIAMLGEERLKVVGAWPGSSFTSLRLYGGVLVTAQHAPLSTGTMLQTLFDGSLGSRYAVGTTASTVTLDLPLGTPVRFVRVYPSCAASYRTNFAVLSTNASGVVVDHSGGFRDMSTCFDNQFFDIGVQRLGVTRVTLSLQSAAGNSYAAALDMEIVLGTDGVDASSAQLMADGAHGDPD